MEIATGLFDAHVRRNCVVRTKRFPALTCLTPRPFRLFAQLENLPRTFDLRARLAKHNAGQVPHTSKFLPWKVATYIAFETLAKAQAFERYLKSGSGHAFAARHF